MAWTLDDECSRPNNQQSMDRRHPQRINHCAADFHRFLISHAHRFFPSFVLPYL